MREMSEKKHMVDTKRKYIIATLGEPTYYLHKVPGAMQYSFSKSIEYATKTTSLQVAEDILNYYYKDLGVQEELVIVPVDITYELVEEICIDTVTH